MPKKSYNIVTVKKEDKEYLFITRGRSKPFSDEEVEEFFGPVAEKEEPTFKVDGHLRRIFSQDLQMGLKHCAQKYGTSEEQILREANRLFPQQNMDRIIGTLTQ